MLEALQMFGGTGLDLVARYAAIWSILIFSSSAVISSKHWLFECEVTIRDLLVLARQ